MSSSDSEDFDDVEVTSLTDAFQLLSKNAKEFYLGGHVPEFESVPDSALTFYRDWISTNRPVIFKNAISHWPAMEKWKTNDYFRKKIGELKVTVSATPNGYADAVVFNSNVESRNDGDAELTSNVETKKEAKFLMPHEEEMTMNDFLNIVEDPASSRGIHYIQKQNSNLTDEFKTLIDDTVEPTWARDAFGKPPDAINFWMGDARAITSTHKDPYENIYCVVRGFKDFVIFPPTDLPWLRYQKCAQAKYVRTPGGDFEVEDLPMPEISWIVVDPLKPDLEKYPEFGNSTPMRFRLNAGDVLYLPSYWFHHLQQSQGCVAVNFWYDMDYDCKWNYFQFLSNVCKVSNETK